MFIPLVCHWERAMSENVQAKQAGADAVQTAAVAKIELAPAAPARSRKAAPRVAAPGKKAAAEAVMAEAPKRAARKPAAPKPAAAPKAPVKAEPAAKAEAVATKPAGKAGKAKKVAPPQVKLVRDSFTIPEADYALFASLKQRALSAGVEMKKSELLRAALALLAATDDAQFIKVVGGVERIKTGRPNK